MSLIFIRQTGTLNSKKSLLDNAENVIIVKNLEVHFLKNWDVVCRCRLGDAAFFMKRIHTLQFEKCTLDRTECVMQERK